MLPPTREWATFPDPDDPDRELKVDMTFLSSYWQCIFGNGCQGILEKKAPELQQGCCSHGAYFADAKDRARTVRAARKLTDDEWQFAALGRSRGVVAKSGQREWRTRRHDGACIFLNRPGFEGGIGCALHIHAMRTGVHPRELKPDVCSQLPLRWHDADDGSVHLTEFGREAWGPGGQDLAWWCTEAPEAYTSAIRVYRGLEAELRHMLGDEIYEEVARRLDKRFGVRDKKRAGRTAASSSNGKIVRARGRARQRTTARTATR